MHARLHIAKVKPGTEDQLIDIWANHGLPVFKRLQGFRGAYVLVDRDGHTGGSLTLWSSQEDAHAMAESSERQEFVARLGDILTGDVVLGMYEVALQG